MSRIKVADADTIPTGQGRVVVVCGIELAVFNVAGRFFCIQNECPHSGGPLGEGYLQGEVVTCPYHYWEFNVRTGEGIYTPGVSVRTFPCGVEEGAVYVEVESARRG